MPLAGRMACPHSLPAKIKGGFWPPWLKSEVRSLMSALRWRRPFAAFGAYGLEIWLDYLLYAVVGLDRRDDFGQFLAIDDHLNLSCVQHFAFDECQRNSDQHFTIGLQQVFRGVVTSLDQL